MGMPLISIITVSYNAVHTVEQTIKSVIDQTYPNIEYIIIDGGSVDGTVDVIRKYSDKISYWISEPDAGIYDAMNKGIVRAKGKWINFMNCGDCFCDNSVLYNIASHCKDNIDVLYGNVVLHSSVGKYKVLPESLEAFSWHMAFCHQSSFVRTSLIKAHLFNLEFKYVADYELFYSLYMEGKRFRYIDISVASYQTDEGLTASNMYKCFLETYKVNNRAINKTEIWKYKIRNFLIYNLPGIFVRWVRLRLYTHNDRFIRLN